MGQSILLAQPAKSKALPIPTNVSLSPRWTPAINQARGFGFALTGLGSGYLITLVGYQPIFLLSAGFTLLSAGLFWRCSSGTRTYVSS